MTNRLREFGVVLAFLGVIALLAVIADAARPAHALVAQQCISPALATQTAQDRDQWKRKAIGLLEACGKYPSPTRTPKE